MHSLSLFFLLATSLTLTSANVVLLPPPHQIKFDPLSNFASNEDLNLWRTSFERERSGEYWKECYRDQYEECRRELNVRTYCCIAEAADGPFTDSCYREAILRGQQCYDSLLTTSHCSSTLLPTPLERKSCCDQAFAKVSAMRAKEQIRDEGCRPATDAEVANYVEALKRQLEERDRLESDEEGVENDEEETNFGEALLGKGRQVVVL